MVPTSIPGVGLIKDIPYISDGMTLDVVRPTAGGPYPVVVALHGTSGSPSGLYPLAELSARQGSVWFMPQWYWRVDYAPGDETSGLDDVAAAVRFARANAATFGGDPGRIILVGHSWGGTHAAIVSMAGDEFTAHGDYGGMSALPDGFVGLDASMESAKVYWPEEAALDPKGWERLEVNTYLDKIQFREGVEFRFLRATESLLDDQAAVEKLTKMGYKAGVEQVDTDHMGILKPRAVTLQAIQDLLYPGGQGNTEIKWAVPLPPVPLPPGFPNIALPAGAQPTSVQDSGSADGLTFQVGFSCPLTMQQIHDHFLQALPAAGFAIQGDFGPSPDGANFGNQAISIVSENDTTIVVVAASEESDESVLVVGPAFTIQTRPN
jgi:pimeloyl-ACP methyl ester carboxylesterase